MTGIITDSNERHEGSRVHDHPNSDSEGSSSSSIPLGNSVNTSVNNNISNNINIINNNTRNMNGQKQTGKNI